jgi:hypothetical protein
MLIGHLIISHLLERQVRTQISVSIFLVLLLVMPLKIDAFTNSTHMQVAINKSTPTENSTDTSVSNIGKPKPLFGSSSEERAGWAFLISGIVLFSIFGAYLLVKGSKIIKDEQGYPSLAKFQFLIWTLVITFSYFGIYLARIFEGILTPPPAISANLLTLMGLTIFVVPVLNKKASNIRYGPTTAGPNISMVSMLQENSKTELTRIQMFAWTLISIFIYLILLYSTVLSNLGIPQNLVLPDIDTNLVVLMGISQGAYLGGKSLMGRATVGAVTPSLTRAAATAAGNVAVPVIITGANFGDTLGQVIYDNSQLLDVTQWTTHRIELTIPYALAIQGAHTVTLVTEKQVTEPVPFNLI